MCRASSAQQGNKERFCALISHLFRDEGNLHCDLTIVILVDVSFKFYSDQNQDETCNCRQKE